MPAYKFLYRAVDPFDPAQENPPVTAFREHPGGEISPMPSGMDHYGQEITLIPGAGAVPASESASRTANAELCS